MKMKEVTGVSAIDYPEYGQDLLALLRELKSLHEEGFKVNSEINAVLSALMEFYNVDTKRKRTVGEC